ncbi:MAG: XRE family transcriptional regulator [Bacteroidales bacterium]|nr:XRE family transcriptional regulator [Bacteroidales bacterium]
MTKKKPHIGDAIRQRMKDNGQSVAWLARQLSCDRSNLHRKLAEPDMDTQLLWRISVVLHFDFFKLFSEEFDAE